MKITEYERGYMDASRDAVSWLHAEAEKMNDRTARSILNGVAHSLGSLRASAKEKARVQRRGMHPLNTTGAKPKA